MNKYNKEGYVLATDDDSSNKSESSDDGQSYKGASKRPASHVIDELDVRGLIDGEEFWERTEDLAACVLGDAAGSGAEIPEKLPETEGEFK